MRLLLGTVTLRAADTGLAQEHPNMRTISISGPRWLARARGLQHDGLSSDRHTRDRALGRGGRDAGRSQDAGRDLASGLDRGGGVRPLDRLHIALVRPPGYFLANAPHLDCVKATYAIPTPSDICCVRLDRGG